MADAFVFLTSITFILLAGIISLVLAKKTKIPLPLFLFLSGLGLGNIFYYDQPLIQLTGTFLSVVSIVALLVVIFEATSRIKVREFDASMKYVFSFFLLSLVLNIVVLSYVSRLFFGFRIFASVIFSLLVSCIEYYTIFPRHHVPNNKIMQLLKDESKLSCAFILVIPFLIISYFLNTVMVPQTLFNTILSFSVNIFAGIGIGVIIALLLFRVVHIRSLERFSSLAVGVAILLAFIVAQQIEGSGLVAVATLGFIFSNIFLRNKNVVETRLHSLYSILEVFIFVLVGLIVGLPLSLSFFRISLGLFVVYLLLRLISAQVTLPRSSVYEKFEIALFVPKGLATIAAAFALLNYTFIGIVLMTQLLLAFFVYSLVFDTILDKAGFYRHR